jgi:Tol biopolymer transport system component
MALLLAIAVFASVPGSLTLDPGLDWFTLETEHFAVHFPCRGPLTDRARDLPARVAAIAEDLHGPMTRKAGWIPRSRTNIIVADFFDYANGWAAPIPDNTITVIPAQPSWLRSNYDDWLRELIAHEYAHVLQTDMAYGFPAGLRAVFGRIAMFNALMPRWTSEGYAQLYETGMTGFGRLRSTEYDMMLRAAALDNALLPLDRCNSYELESYPSGEAPYLYGGMFMRDALLDPDWDQYSRRRAGGLPFFDNWYSRRVFGSSFPELWQTWQQETRTRAEVTAARLRREGLTPLRTLTREGFYTSSPCWSGSGDRVYYVSRTGEQYTAIASVDTAGRDRQRLYEGLVTGNLSLSPDGRRLAFGEYSLRHNYYYFSDIVELDLGTGSTRRLTNMMRAQDPDFSPDGSTMVFVSGHKGSNELILLDLNTGKTSPLIRTFDYTGYSSPRFSPSGRFVATAVRKPGGYADIVLIDRSTGWQIPVTEDRAVDMDPCWSRSGHYLYFISDRDGVFNLYAYSMLKQETFRCTNVLLGVFQPAVSPDNRYIALLEYGSAGYDLASTSVVLPRWTEASVFDDTFPTAEYDLAEPLTTLYYYNPFPTILPKLWYPWVGNSGDLAASAWSFGAGTFGWDALQFHRYTIAAGYRLSGTPFADIGYAFSKWWPQLSLALSADFDLQTATIGAGLPFLYTRRSTWLDFAANVSHDSIFETRYAAAFSSSTALQYRFAVAPRTGHQLNVYTDLQSSSMLAPRTRLRLLAGFGQWLSLPWLSSLRARLVFGTGLGDTSRSSSWQIPTGYGLTSVRGFSAATDPCQGIILPSVQLSLPLWWVERGISTAPVFLRNVNGSVFLDCGVTAASLLPELEELEQTRLGAGAELGLDLVLFHMLPVVVRAGYARGLLPEPDSQFYLGFESSLLGEILSSGLDPNRVILSPRTLSPLPH